MLSDAYDTYYESVMNMYKAIEPISTNKTYQKNTVLLNLSEPSKYFYLIESGIVGFYRKNDRLLVHEQSAPSVIGVYNIFQTADIIVMAHADVIIKCAEEQEVLAIIEQRSLWKDVAIILSRMLKRYTERDYNLIAQDAYFIVKYHLQLIMTMDINTRLTTTAHKFITSRTLLSRSRVMDILKQLNVGDFITMKKGILISINTLPERF